MDVPVSAACVESATKHWGSPAHSLPAAKNGLAAPAASGVASWLMAATTTDPGAEISGFMTPVAVGPEALKKTTLSAEPYPVNSCSWFAPSVRRVRLTVQPT